MQYYDNIAIAIVISLAATACFGQVAHDHPTEGPHHGSLIELGAEEYHAEFVHNEVTGEVTIYLLDNAAKLAVPIAAKEIMINLKHDGHAEQFALTALPQSEDPEGMSSRFVCTDTELGDDIEHADADAKLVIKIKGKSFRGTIKHDHDH